MSAYYIGKFYVNKRFNNDLLFFGRTRVNGYKKNIISNVLRKRICSASVSFSRK